MEEIYAERLPRRLIFFSSNTQDFAASVRKDVNQKEAFSLTCMLSTSTYTPMEIMA